MYSSETKPGIRERDMRMLAEEEMGEPKGQTEWLDSNTQNACAMSADNAFPSKLFFANGRTSGRQNNVRLLIETRVSIGRRHSIGAFPREQLRRSGPVVRMHGDRNFV
ncbi:MAG: hypothetical protein Fues2KO_07370 [Fuerstiella sp.]